MGRALILSSLVNSRFDAHLLDVWRSVFLMMLLLFCHGSHYGKRLTETRLFYSRALACLCRSTRGLPLNYSLCSLFFFTNVASAFQEKVGSKSVDLTTLLEHHAFSPPLMQKTSAAGWLKEKKKSCGVFPVLLSTFLILSLISRRADIPAPALVRWDDKQTQLCHNRERLSTRRSQPRRMLESRRIGVADVSLRKSCEAE